MTETPDVKVFKDFNDFKDLKEDPIKR